MKYKVGDVVQLKEGHSEGDDVIIEAIESGSYKIYIPYWDFFYITDNDIIGLHPDFN